MWRRLLSLGSSARRSVKPVFSAASTGSCLAPVRYLSTARFSCWNCHVEFRSFKYFCPNCSKLQKPSDRVSFFDLFDMACSFDIDAEDLTKRFRTIQSQLHPDKFVLRDESERQVSAEFSSLVNKAYSTLASPIGRAAYMLQLRDVAVAEGTTQTDHAFLAEIMQLNEEIDAAGPDNLLQLERQNQMRLAELYSEFSKSFNQGDWEQSKRILVKIKYFVSIQVRIKDIKIKSLD